LIHGFATSNEYRIIAMKTALMGSMRFRSIHDDAVEQARRVGRRDFKQPSQTFQPLDLAWFHAN